MATVAVLGALDTKGDEVAYVRNVLRSAGVNVLVVDIGVLGEPVIPADIAREEVARAAGHDLAALAEARDRGGAVTAMAQGAKAVLARLVADGRVDGALGLGGTAGTTVAASALSPLPLGLPKAIVSTAASGNTYAYIRESDLVLFPSVVDIAGLNRVSRPILRNAALAVAGMVSGTSLPRGDGDKPLIAASMFGVTTPAVERARARLEGLGYEVLVFHMTGTGGRAMESLIAQGIISGVLDITTTELADELAGGIFDAGEERLTSATATGTPQVVSVGALDMVNFGPPDTVPERYRERTFYQHNPNTTLMRTTPEECAELGARLAARLAGGTGPSTVFLPLRGISAIAVEGQPFHDAEADRQLFDAVRSGLAGSAVELVEVDAAVNDPVFADAMADRLAEYLAASVAVAE